MVVIRVPRTLLMYWYLFMLLLWYWLWLSIANLLLRTDIYNTICALQYMMCELVVNGIDLILTINLFVGRSSTSAAGLLKLWLSSYDCSFVFAYKYYNISVQKY